MDHYLDMRLLPDPEFPQHQLMDALFAKLHRCLVAHGASDIGISFPAIGTGSSGMGDRLRLHGSAQALKHCMAHNWLQGMRDHVDYSGVMEVPEHRDVQTVRRVQCLGASDLRRLRKRLMARTGCSESEAEESIPDAAAERLKLPFITLRSTSSGQTFRLFVRQSTANATVTGSFSAYGLSQTATLPRFA